VTGELAGLADKVAAGVAAVLRNRRRALPGADRPDASGSLAASEVFALGCGGVSGNEPLYCVRAEPGAAPGREQRVFWVAVLFVYPGVEELDGRLVQRRSWMWLISGFSGSSRGPGRGSWDLAGAHEGAVAARGPGRQAPRSVA
jgi:hypothetical protein